MNSYYSQFLLLKKYCQYLQKVHSDKPDNDTTLSSDY